MRTQCSLALAGLLTLAACGGERGREVAVTDSLSRELETAPADTLASPEGGRASDDERRTEAGGRASTAARRPATVKAPARKRAARRPVPAVAADSERHEPTVPSPGTALGDTGRVADRAPDAASTDSARSAAPADSSMATAPSDDSSATSVSSSAPATAPAGTAPVATAPAATAPARTAPAAAPAPAETRSAATAPPPSPTVAGDSSGVAAADMHALPAGTQVRALLQDSISSLRNSAGQTVTALVSGDMRAPDGRTLVPSGSAVRLSITRLKPARTRSALDGELELRADSVVVGGRAYPIRADVQPVPHELKGRGVTAGEAEKVAAGAAAGAVAGGVITGKTKGAVIGGVVGAAGGAVVAAQTASRDVIVTPRTLVVLTLTAPFAAREGR